MYVALVSEYQTNGKVQYPVLSVTTYSRSTLVQHSNSMLDDLIFNKQAFSLSICLKNS